MPEVSLWHEFCDQSHGVLQQAGPKELHDVAVVQGLEDGHFVQEGLPASGILGLEHLHCHLGRGVQLSQVHLQMNTKDYSKPAQRGGVQARVLQLLCSLCF